jgi:XTP/dITP diphosphohydrolase
MKLLVATHNKGKIKEYQELLSSLPVELVGLDEAGITDDLEETGTTFTANAILKAEGYAQMAGIMAMADDSGLVIDALDGRPGVYSARYGKPGLDDAGRRAVVLDEMIYVDDNQRTARFMCVIALHDPRNGQTHTVEGVCEGRILREERDEGYGFGYDALFVPDGYVETFAEMTSDVKHRISHRGRAVAKLPALLEKILKA